jgi:hypothetical protein
VTASFQSGLSSTISVIRPEDRARKIMPIVFVQNHYSFADRESEFIVSHPLREFARLIA